MNTKINNFILKNIDFSSSTNWCDVTSNKELYDEQEIIYGKPTHIFINAKTRYLIVLLQIKTTIIPGEAYDYEQNQVRILTQIAKDNCYHMMGFIPKKTYAYLIDNDQEPYLVALPSNNDKRIHSAARIISNKLNVKTIAANKVAQYLTDNPFVLVQPIKKSSMNDWNKF